MERIRFHVFFKISLIGCSGLLSFSPNKEKKKKIKHIQVIKKKDSNLESKHNNHISIQNEDIKKAIKLYISSNKEE